jgi:hypothetical protein
MQGRVPVDVTSHPMESLPRRVLHLKYDFAFEIVSIVNSQINWCPSHRKLIISIQFVDKVAMLRYFSPRASGFSQIWTMTGIKIATEAHQLTCNLISTVENVMTTKGRPIKTLKISMFKFSNSPKYPEGRPLVACPSLITSYKVPRFPSN